MGIAFIVIAGAYMAYFFYQWEVEEKRYRDEQNDHDNYLL